MSIEEEKEKEKENTKFQYDRVCLTLICVYLCTTEMQLILVTDSKMQLVLATDSKMQLVLATDSKMQLILKCNWFLQLILKCNWFLQLILKCNWFLQLILNATDSYSENDSVLNSSNELNLALKHKSDKFAQREIFTRQLLGNKEIKIEVDPNPSSEERESDLSKQLTKKQKMWPIVIIGKYKPEVDGTK
ncbi:hypothetical protein LOAG_10005 [Loa loa]|uniref:Uncharacterized protein n=1 Tax=Loa loa TaxID=7209 RepID=A0A1S0TQL1_LOALO|nr:hypothetical protein LOAG_10005 [Loa loa]EFO18493.1 hypothetical protein LOAG_10005 [Loa loa]